MSVQHCTSTQKVENIKLPLGLTDAGRYAIIDVVYSIV